VIYRRYGRTGKEVSAVGFGGMRFDMKQSKGKNAQLLLYAWEKGINYFDTAPTYCNDQSESIFGLALKQMQGVRDKICVATKGMPTSIGTVDQARAAVEKSLRRLNLERIDFYFVWCVRKMAHYESAMQKGGLYEGLLKCKEEGLIDHIMISTHLPGDKVSWILSKNEFEGVLMGVNILNFPYRWEAVRKGYEMGLGVSVMNPLGGGTIPQCADSLTYLGSGNETPVEAALRFCLSCPEITAMLNGFTTKAHIDMACRVADESRPFGREEFEQIRKRVALGMDELCTGCGYCLSLPDRPDGTAESGCPQNIPIASYLQFYNKKLLLGKSTREMIKLVDEQYVWGLLADRQGEAGDCTECGRCEEKCTQHLNIMERLKEIAKWESKIQKDKNKR